MSSYMNTVITGKRSRSVVSESPPPLLAGDHLTMEEFRRRYEAAPDMKKAELINGIVYMPPPVFGDHSVPDNIAATCLGLYSVHTIGTEAHNDRTLQLIGHSQVQPDVCLVILPECGGKTFVKKSKELAGSPELVVEVAAASVNYDLFEKKNAYHSNQIQEYTVWQTLDKRLDWFEWTPAEYTRRSPDKRGLLKSKVFPGLWLNASALLQEKYELVIKILEQGLRSPEHASFVARLSRLKRHAAKSAK